MNNEPPVRIILADDCPLTLNGVKIIFENNSMFNIITSVKNGKELLKEHFKHMPDLIITDISMPELSGIDAVMQIKKTDEKVKVLFLSVFSGESLFRICVQAGAHGLILKEVANIEMINAIKTVISDGYYYGKPLSSFELDEIMNKINPDENYTGPVYCPVHYLSKKEMKIFRLIGQGLETEVICTAMKITDRTYRFHQNNIMRKLEIESKIKLSQAAYRYLLEESLGKIY